MSRTERLDEMATLCATLLDTETLRFVAWEYERVRPAQSAPNRLRDLTLTEHESRYVAERFRSIADERSGR